MTLRFIAALALALLTAGFGGMVPVERLTPPTEASANGFTTLAMNLDCVTGLDLGQNGATDPHMFYTGIWYQAPSFSDVPAQYIFPDCANGAVIHLQWVSAFGTPTGAQSGSAGCPYPTETAAACPSPIVSSGSQTVNHSRAVGHGYMEWVYRATPNSTAFDEFADMQGLQTAKDCLANGYPAAWPSLPPQVYSEFSAERTFSAQTELHVGKNYNAASTGCGDPATPQYQATATLLDTSVFHKFGMLWTGAGSDNFCWYLDDAQVGCATTAAGDEAQLFLYYVGLFQYCAGQVNSTSCSPPSQIDVYVQSLRYWSCASWQTNALAC